MQHRFTADVWNQSASGAVDETHREIGPACQPRRLRGGACCRRRSWSGLTSSVRRPSGSWCQRRRRRRLDGAACTRCWSARSRFSRVSRAGGIWVRLTAAGREVNRGITGVVFQRTAVSWREHGRPAVGQACRTWPPGAAGVLPEEFRRVRFSSESNSAGSRAKVNLRGRAAVQVVLVPCQLQPKKQAEQRDRQTKSTLQRRDADWVCQAATRQSAAFWRQ